MEKILIVEDEVRLREELKKCLENNGYMVLELTSFTDTVSEILKSNADLVLLDINLPNLNGEYVCKQIRKNSNIPIIIVTSKNSEIDELLSINFGADDYVVKPYNIQILLARINRLLKRNISIENLKYKNITLDLSKGYIIKDDQKIELSKNEQRIFSFLLNNSTRIVTRDELMDYLWDNDEFVDDNTLNVNINRLRNKLSEFGYDDAIITKRGQGYILL